MNEQAHCLKCGKPVPQASTGRPRSYCSTGCRRAAEKEVLRLNGRLDHLETQAMNARLGRGMPLPGELDKLEAEIARSESRLRNLLEASPE